MVMTKSRRLLLLILIDSLIVTFSIYMSHFFLNPYFHVFNQIIFVTSLMLLITHHLFSWILGMYRKKWRYANMEELVGLGVVVSSSVLSTAILQLGMFGQVYERALIVTWMLHVLLIGGVRFTWRYYNTYGFTLHPGLKKVKLNRNNPDVKQTVIVGAGSAGQMLANQMKGNNDSTANLIGFIDDNELIQNMSIGSVPVLGKTKDFERMAEKKKSIMLSLPCRRSSDQESVK